MNMDRAIFELNLGVEPTSLYILTCAIIDQSESPTLNRIQAQWNGTREGLRLAAEELIQHGVVNGTLPLEEDEPLHINPKEKWH